MSAAPDGEWLTPLKDLSRRNSRGRARVRGERRLAVARLGISLSDYSRGRPGVPDSRTFLSVYEDRGITFKDAS